VPTAPVTIAVALADKLDSLSGFFAANEKPTGSKDPFALRRAALGILSIVRANELEMAVAHTIIEAISRLPFAPITERILDEFDRDLLNHFREITNVHDRIVPGLLISRDVGEFIVRRLQVDLRSAGNRADFVDAALMTGTNNFLSLVRRAEALQKFVETDGGADLLTAYKRAANILKKEKWEGADQSGGSDIEPQEQALTGALDAAEPKAAAAVEAEDFTGAMAALATLRRPIDDFFDHVTVNDPDPTKRARRLSLLARFRDAVNRVADFSKIEG